MSYQAEKTAPLILWPYECWGDKRGVRSHGMEAHGFLDVVSFGMSCGGSNDHSAIVKIKTTCLVYANPACMSHVVVWGRNVHHGLRGLNTCPQLVVLSGGVLEPLGSGALLEEVHHWGQALRFCSLAPTSCSGVQRKCDLSASSLLASPCFCCLPHHDELHGLWNYKPKSILSLLRCFFIWVFYHNNMKYLYILLIL